VYGTPVGVRPPLFTLVFAPLTRYIYGSYHLVFIGAMCNFELGPSGELSVNGIERCLAESLCIRSQPSFAAPLQRPNRLTVTVVKARHLRLPTKNPRLHSVHPPLIGKGTFNGDPFVSVRARSTETFTKVVMKSDSPMWNEKFHLHVMDPSTVLTVNVWDEDVIKSPLIGRWVITLKYLITDPTNCENGDEFTVTRLPPDRDGKNGGTRISGWFPLVDSEYKNCGTVGEVFLNIEWANDPDFDIGYTPSPRPDAMGQLLLNAEENDYRGGDPEGDLNAWKSFPVLFNCRMIVIHEVAFFIKDVFAGSKGFKSMDSKNAIRMPHIYMTQGLLESPDNFPGLTLWGLMNVAVIQAALPQCLANSEFRNSAAWSVLSGTVRGFGQHNKWKRRRDVVKKAGDTSTMAETFGQKLNRKWQLVTKGEQFINKQVQATDDDALLSPKLSGYLEKTSKSPTMLPNVFRNWHPVLVEVRGSTLYYYPVNDGMFSKSQGETAFAIHGSARKIELRSLRRAETVEEGSEMMLISWDDTVPNRYFRLSSSGVERDGAKCEMEFWVDLINESLNPGTDDEDVGHESDDHMVHAQTERKGRFSDPPARSRAFSAGDVKTSPARERGAAARGGGSINEYDEDLSEAHEVKGLRRQAQHDSREGLGWDEETDKVRKGGLGGMGGIDEQTGAPTRKASPKKGAFDFGSALKRRLKSNKGSN